MKSFFCKYSKLIFCAVIAMSINVYAQNENDAIRLGIPGLGSSARALGMGNSYVGLSDDGAAAYFNPAGFGLIKKLEISGSLSFNNFNNNTTFFNTYTDYSKNATRLNNLSFAFPFPTTRGSLVFGVTYHTTKDLTRALKFDGFDNTQYSLIQDLNRYTYIPFDLYLTDNNFNTPIKGGLNQSGSIISTGALNNWTFSGAIEAYKNFFLGLNLNIITGSYDNNYNFYEDDTRGNYANIRTDADTNFTYGFQQFHLNKITNWDISGWDAKFGALYQIENIARIGITIQFPKTYTIKEKYTVNGSATFSDYSASLNSSDYSFNDQFDVVTPYELSAGGSVSFKGLILSGQITQIDYSQLKFDNASGISVSDIETANNNISNDLRSVINYNVGAEYTIPNVGLRLRAGYFVMPSAYQNDPSKYNRKYLTFGAGYLLNGMVDIDVAYAHGLWKTFGNNYYYHDVAQSITYQSIKNNFLIFSMNYRF